MKKIYELAHQFAIRQWGKPRRNTVSELRSDLAEFGDMVMSLPLAQRLTAEEKEKIQEQYDEVRIFTENIDPCEETSEYYLGQKVVLERIFGKELFEQ